MGFLRVLGLRLELTWGVRHVLAAIAFGDDLADLLHGGPGQRDRIGAHIRDQADVALAG